MKGKWVYIAGAVLAGTMLALGYRLLAVPILLFAMLRIPFDKRIAIPVASAALIALINAGHKEKMLVSEFAEGPADLQLTFVDTPRIDGNILRTEAFAGRERLVVSYRIPSREEKSRIAEGIAAGTVCKVEGKMEHPGGRRNEHAFDYREFLRGRNIHWILQADSIRLDTCSRESVSIVYTLRNVRALALERVKSTFPERLLPYANALLFGDRDAFGEEEIDAYQRLGIVHLLAISGLHVGLIAGGLHFLLIRAGLTREAVFWLMLAALPAYAVLSGGNPPVIRAAGMSLLLLAASKWRFPLTTLDALSVSFITFTLYHPYILLHAGFQLSYAVSFGIVVSAGRILHNQSSLKSLTILSVVSLLSSFPILSWHFYEFSLLSAAANILYIPFYSFVVLPGIIGLFFIQWVHPSLFLFFASGLERLVVGSEKIALWFGKLPFAVLLTGKPAPLMLFFMTLSVIVCFLFYEKGKGLFVSAIPLLFLLLLQLLSIHYSPKGEVVFIDVGQGDSTLIKLPYNRGIYLIDTGGRIEFPMEDWERREKTFGVGKNVVLPLLKSKGINRIDKLLLTHSDADHIGAANELLGIVKIREMYISPNSGEKPIMENLLQEAENHRIPVREIKAGSGWANRSGTFQILYPFSDQYKGNDSSLVLWAEFGGQSWLFTGDVEEAGEADLVKMYGDLKADVLKAGHHGSRTSSTEPFLQAVRPQTVVISAGMNNRYGHPHSEALGNLQREADAVYRTDRQGAIHYRFRGKSGTFMSILP